MTPDEVLEQIDHAVDDWAVSEDAMRWLPEPVQDFPGDWRSVDIQPAYRVYATTDPDASPVYVDEWEPLGHTVDGATFTYRAPRAPRGYRDYRVHTQPPAPLPEIDLHREAIRALMERMQPAIHAAAWQIDHMARALARVGVALPEVVAGFPRGTETEPLPVATDDPDRPGHPLRIAGGRDAQRSPYGPQPRGRR